MTILLIANSLSLYAQDTTVNIKVSHLRALYKDAVKYDSCKANVERYKEIVDKKDDIIKNKDEIISNDSKKLDACNSELESVECERNNLADDLKKEKQKVQNKNKWIARLSMALTLETLVLVLILM